MVVVATTLLAGCGGGDSGPTGPDAKALARAIDKTRDERSARILISAQIGKELVQQGRGVTRLDSPKMQLTLVFQPSRPERTVDHIVIGYDNYTGTGPPGSPYFHSRADETVGGDGSSGLGVAFSAWLDYLEAGAVDVTAHGDTLSGTLDFERVAEHLPEDERAAFRRMRERKQISKNAPIRLAVDSSGRLVALRCACEEGGKRVDLTFELSGFGAAADIEVPDQFK